MQREERLRLDPLRGAGRRLTALHTVEGKYVYLHEKAFSAAGIDHKPLIDRRWQDFAASQAQMDTETSAIQQAMHSDDCVHLTGVKRRWGTRVVILQNRITVMRAPGRAKLILREASIVDDYTAGDGVALADGAVPGPRRPTTGTPCGETRRASNLDIMADNLLMLRSLLGGDEHRALANLIDLARYMTDQQRDEADTATL